MKRVVLIVMDSLGVGQLPDAHEFGDSGANTFQHIVENTNNFKIPNLKKIGFYNIDGVLDGNKKEETPTGSYCKLKELSKGKDTITGHWEIAGIKTDIPFKTYPNGFPSKFINAFEKEIGSKVIGNYPASGTEIIEKLGKEHEETGNPIVYTSADSVFQIAANVDVIPLKRLYEICQIARNMLHGEFACGRVIARPYIIKNGKRIRTSDRHDYSVEPHDETLLDIICSHKKTVYAIGKISDIFAGRGISKSVHTISNMDGVDKTIEALKDDFEGLIFTNLVDFDSKFGHRRDPIGYGQAIMEFDKRIPEITKTLKKDDIMMICADHGNDPVHSGWDHTREYIPLVVFGNNVKSKNLGIRKTFGDIGASIADYLNCKKTKIGESFMKDVLK